MRVGIVVHSETGHTILLARAVADKLRKNGDEVDIHLLRALGKIKPGKRKVDFRRVPDPRAYDTLLVGGPVWALNCSPAVGSYLENLPDNSLENKLCLPFVTMGLPIHALNGNRALAEMNAKLASKGGSVLPGHAMHWFINADKAAIEFASSIIYKRIHHQSEIPSQEQSSASSLESKPSDISLDTRLE